MPNKKLPLDRKWYNEFKGNVSLMVSHYYLRSSRRDRVIQQKKFLAGGVENPSFDYPRINLSYFEDRIKEVEAFRERLIAKESHPVVRQAYLWRIDEVLGKAHLLKAAAQRDMSTFRRQTEHVYGAPSFNIFAYTLDAVHDACEAALDSKDAEAKNIAKRLQDILPSRIAHDPIPLPSSEVLDRTFAYIIDHLSPILSTVTSSQKRWGGEDLRQAFIGGLHAFKLYDWSAILSDAQYYMSIEHHHKEVRLPHARKISRKRLLELLVHEIGVHIVRRVNGMQSPLLLLGSGLDRYDRGEEGVATLYEEAVSGSFRNFVRPERYLAIGFALGLDGTPRNFREVYDILELYYKLRRLQYVQAAKASPEQRAWETCVRIFRGTDCKTKGVCFTKDIIYQDGNIRVWETIAKKPEELKRLHCGKYDPANERHRWILDELNIH